MATKFKVTKDGVTETYTVKPKHILKSERLGKDEAPAESAYHLAWFASGSELPFDEWIETVDDIEPIFPEDEKQDEEDVPPTTAGSRRSRPTPA